MSFGANIRHDQVDERVKRETIVLQLETAAALERLLDEHGGVILGDEVGSGKTYVTFALLVETLIREPRKGAAIFVPNETLKSKWCRQLQEYIDAAVVEESQRRRLRSRITPIGRSLRDDGSLNPERCGQAPMRNAIVVATHGIYSRKVSVADYAACLKAAATKLDVGRRIQKPRLLEACGFDPYREDEPYWAEPDLLTPAVLEPLRPVLETYAAGGRSLNEKARDAVQKIRRRAGAARLPSMALAVIDEAHHLRSPKSSVYQALESVLAHRFDRLLFLTATPFQLGREELLHIVEFFRLARTSAGGEEEFEQRLGALRAAMDGWMDSLAAFIDAWADLDRDQADRCESLVESGTAPAEDDDGLTVRAATRFRNCLQAKEVLEHAMRPFLVRSVRERPYREKSGVEPEFIAEETRIPLALVDRLLVEEMAKKRKTFISSALIDACSSWPALERSALMTDEERDSDLRTALSRMLSAGMVGSHPKVAKTVATCQEGIAAGEKTLVFVARRQTGLVLREEIEAAIAADTPAEGGSDADRRRRQSLQERSRFGWPSLRENYLHTIFPLVFGEEANPGEAELVWAEPQWRDLWQRVDRPEEKRDYSVEKRFWEHALFRRATERHPGWQGGHGRSLVECTTNILEPDYILNGIDLVSGTNDVRIAVPKTPERADARAPRIPFAEAFIDYPSPWVVASEQLAALAPRPRASFVDAAASAIAASHFREELAQLVVDGDPAAHFRQVAEVLIESDNDWPRRFSQLAEQARDAVATDNADLAAERIERLIKALSRPNRVQYVDGKTGPDTKRNAVDGFNTPLYPDVIVTTEVLAEGLDLHRYCRRVIHHDLPWNPATLEQRTGRVDRVGSLSERLQAERPDGDWKIDVWLPFVPGTYDEFVYERVLARRREFRCILGERPEWKAEELGEREVTLPVAEPLVRRLQVDLRPSGTGGVGLEAAKAGVIQPVLDHGHSSVERDPR